MSSNDGQFCQGKILHIPWHQLISSSGGNSLQTNSLQTNYFKISARLFGERTCSKNSTNIMKDQSNNRKSHQTHQLTAPENTITSLFVTPKFWISIVFSFSWELKQPQEKLKTMLMQNFGVTNKQHYGMLWYFLEWSIAITSKSPDFNYQFPSHLKKKYNIISMQIQKLI